MKLHQIALAMTALAAGAANAAAPADATFSVYLDGATAVKNSVVDVAKAMCLDAAHTQAYQGGTGNKITAVYCSDVNTTNSGLAAGTKLWVTKNNVDGSAETFLRAIMRTAQTDVLDPATCPLPTYAGTTLTCSGTIKVNAQGGFSDVDEKVWIARGVYIPAPGVSITVKSGFAGQGFGVAVTDKLYMALQAAQGLTVGLPTSATLTAADLANQPNITKQQFTSILNGAGAYHTDWSPFLPSTDATRTNNMVLCRRVDTSGTQAGMEAYFLNNPCANANPTFGELGAARQTDTAGSFKVYEAPGTGDVIACLNAHNDDTVDAARLADGTAVDEYAIGIMSLENYYGHDAVDHWKFVKLDGVTPNPDSAQRQTVIDGKYNYAFESVFAYRNDNDTAHKNFMNKFVALMGNPAKVNPLVGIFSVPGASDYFTFPTRVHRGTTGGNACAPFSLTE